MTQGRRRTRLLIYTAITLFAMCNTIRRMFEGVKPFDWLMLGIETAVLLLILYEVIVGVMRHREAEKRRKQLAKVTQILSDFMFEGQSIQGETPNPHTGGDVTRWVSLVTEWHIKVAQYLSSISSRAESAFSLIINAEQAGSHILHQPGDSVGFYVTGHEGTHYRKLMAYLQNLRGIIEKLDAYF
jgi:hypothetical protein